MAERLLILKLLLLALLVLVLLVELFELLVRLLGVNPWDGRPTASLMTADCYCRGSELLERRFRWRYTSVPYLLSKEKGQYSSRHWIGVKVQEN